MERRLQRVSKALSRIGRYPFQRLSKMLSRKGLYPFLEEQFNLIPRGAKVLNVGSGGEVGRILDKYSVKNGYSVISFDIDTERGSDIVGDIATYDFGNEKFDYVIMSEVLEHVCEPQMAIRNILNILNNDGCLIITVPFIFPIHESPHDYYRYTLYGLRYLLRNFSRVKIEARNSWADALNVIIARFSVESPWTSRLFAPFATTLAVLLQPFMWVLGNLIKTDNSTSGYIGVAKK